MVRLISIIVIIFFAVLNVSAQRVAVSANLADMANFGTLSGEVSFAASRHISVNAGVRYNPWQYGSQEKGFIQNRKREADVYKRQRSPCLQRPPNSFLGNAGEELQQSALLL